jgi:flagellar hook-associated protein 2
MPESSPITFGGLGSGLDTKAIIEALVEVEKIPIKMLEANKVTEQKKLELYGTFKGHVAMLRDKANELSTLTGFLAYSVGASSSTAATFSATGAAAVGAHTLMVQQLAAADRWAFDAVLDPDVDLATADGQSVTFTIDGTDYDVPVTQSASSLKEIAAAINDVAGEHVSASVVNAGSSGSPSWRLVVAAKATGVAQRISNFASTISGLTIDGTGPDAGGNPQSLNQLTVGMDARAVIDGLGVLRSDNDFSDVIEGVSITLLEADPGTTVTFTVEPDKQAIQGKLQEFVDAYNELTKFINKQNAYDEKTGPGGLLFGDNSLRTITSLTRNVLFNQSLAQIGQDLEGFGSLRLVGVETNKDGTLKINQQVFDKKFSEDLQALADLFVDKDGFDNGGAAIGTPEYYIDTTADSGLLDDLFREFDRITKSYGDGAGNSYDGLFDVRTKAINARIKSIDKQIADREFRLDKYQANLEARFANLEKVMAQLQAQGAYLAQPSSSGQ